MVKQSRQRKKSSPALNASAALSAGRTPSDRRVAKASASKPALQPSKSSAKAATKNARHAPPLTPTMPSGAAKKATPALSQSNTNLARSLQKKVHLSKVTAKASTPSSVTVVSSGKTAKLSHTNDAKSREVGASKLSAHSGVSQKRGTPLVKKADEEVRKTKSKSAPATKISVPDESLIHPPAIDVRSAVLHTQAPLKTGRLMGKTARSETTTVQLPPDYRPSDQEPFMNAQQRAYFKNKLQQLKDDIIKQNRETLQTLHEDTAQHSDLADRATSETDRALELRTRDRQRKLVGKIDAAITRIDDGSYGYCEETGEPINLRRLDARPIATLSLEAQERHERREKVYRED